MYPRVVRILDLFDLYGDWSSACWPASLRHRLKDGEPWTAGTDPGFWINGVTMNL